MDAGNAPAARGCCVGEYVETDAVLSSVLVRGRECVPIVSELQGTVGAPRTVGKRRRRSGGMWRQAQDVWDRSDRAQGPEVARVSLGSATVGGGRSTAATALRRVVSEPVSMWLYTAEVSATVLWPSIRETVVMGVPASR